MAGQNLNQGQTQDQLKDQRKDQIKDQQLEGWREGQLVTPSRTQLNEATHFSYHELDTQPVQQMSPLEQLEKNLSQLSLTSSKLKFMMREIRYIMKV